MWWNLRNQISGFKELIFLYRQYIVLLALVIVSVILLQTNTNPQITFFRQRFLYMASLTGYYADKIPSMISRADYERLQEQNLELVKRNIVLEDALIENVKLRKIILFQERFPLTTTAAHILTKIPDPNYNTIVLNAGFNRGIRKDMNVISLRGLIGKISEIYDDHSVCEIMLDERFRSAGKIQRTRLDGIILWKGSMNEMGFYGVLKHFDVRIGDVILTSEYSDHYMPNVPVGVVYNINNEVPGLFKDIRLRTHTDFHTLEDVFILTDTARSKTLQRGFEQAFIKPGRP